MSVNAVDLEIIMLKNAPNLGMGGVKTAENPFSKMNNSFASLGASSAADGEIDEFSGGAMKKLAAFNQKGAAFGDEMGEELKRMGELGSVSEVQVLRYFILLRWARSRLH